MSFLDILIDGEIVKEAAFADLTKGEKKLVYKGTTFNKEIYKILYFIFKDSMRVKYMVIASLERKYLIINYDKKFVILGLNAEVNAENYLSQIKNTISKILV
ncbi:MAG: hypothetical protein NZ922_06150 [Candidatus Methanomethyliaceae archaeon]|nr:hypothetical protein [Candidatus Methanomethyliaceae archaeon]MDW7971487.1 hypothetical protein [Nitrososphaerota archaeon]